MALSVEYVREQLITVFDSFTCGVLADVNRKIVFANRGVTEMLGYPRDSLYGKEFRDLVPPELHAALEEESKLVDQGDLRARLIGLRRRDGTGIPVLVLPMMEFESMSGALYGFLVLIDLGAVGPGPGRPPPAQLPQYRQGRHLAAQPGRG